MKHYLSLTVLMALVLAASCTTQTPGTSPPNSILETTETTQTDIFTPTESTSPFLGSEPTLCSQLGAATATGVVSDSRIIEASGLVYGNRGLWVHNDSESPMAVHRLNESGEVIQSVQISVSSAYDIEDIAFAEGRLFLADTGDNINTDARSSVRILEFVEPEAETTSVAPTEFVVTYEDGPRDVEAMFFDPLTTELVLIEKSIGLEAILGATAPAGIYMADLTAGETVFERTGEIELGYLNTIATGETPPGQVGTVSGVVTGADISRDGTIIALRTYKAVWLFEREPNESVTEALQSQPCQAPSAPEAQGESIALTNNLLGEFTTISEGNNQSLFTTSRN